MRQIDRKTDGRTVRHTEIWTYSATGIHIGSGEREEMEGGGREKGRQAWMEGWIETETHVRPRKCTPARPPTTHARTHAHTLSGWKGGRL